MKYYNIFEIRIEIACGTNDVGSGTTTSEYINMYIHTCTHVFTQTQAKVV